MLMHIHFCAAWNGILFFFLIINFILLVIAGRRDNPCTTWHLDCESLDLRIV